MAHSPSPLKPLNRDQRAPTLSFEFFPPRNAKMLRALWRNVGQLELLSPDFFSVTYGALASQNDNSRESVLQLHQETCVPICAHLTASSGSCAQIDAYAQDLFNHGVRHLVALRGDASSQGDSYPDATALIGGLKNVADFDLSVAAYPDIHPKATNAASDLQVLVDKFDAGANRALTQYFFDPYAFLALRERAAKAGIRNEIRPGILPIHDFARVLDFSKRCGAKVPKPLISLFEGTEGNLAVQRQLGVDIATELCQTLQDEGVNSFHFYTLNIPGLSFEVCRQLGAPLSRRIAMAA